MSPLIIIEDYCRKILHSATVAGQMEGPSKNWLVSYWLVAQVSHCVCLSVPYRNCRVAVLMTRLLEVRPDVSKSVAGFEQNQF